MANAPASWGVYVIPTGATAGTSAPITVTAGAASANSALPTTSDAKAPRFIRLLAVTNNAWVRLGTSNGVTVTGGAGGNGVLVGPNNDLVLNATGYSHIAYIRQGGADVLVNICPVEV